MGSDKTKDFYRTETPSEDGRKWSTEVALSMSHAELFVHTKQMAGSLARWPVVRV
jgi:hypothetical protein